MRHQVSWRHDFWSTGLWVGLRIYLIPLLVFCGFYAWSDAGGGLMRSQMDRAFAPAGAALVQIQSGLAGLGGSRLPANLTPGPGAKWVRP